MNRLRAKQLTRAVRMLGGTVLSTHEVADALRISRIQAQAMLRHGMTRGLLSRVKLGQMGRYGSPATWTAKQEVVA